MDFDQLGNITFMDDNMNNNNNIKNNHQMKLNNNLAADNDVTCNNCKQNSINQQVLDAINELNDSNKEILKQQAEQTKFIKDLTSI